MHKYLLKSEYKKNGLGMELEMKVDCIHGGKKGMCTRGM